MATLADSPRRCARTGAFFGRWAVALAFGATLAGAACVTPIAEQRWRAVSTGGLHGMSSASPSQTEALVRELDVFLRLFDGLTGRASVSPTVPARVYIFGDARTFEWFRPLANVAGYAAAREDAVHIVMHAADTESALELIRHELVHFALGRASSVRYPLWYEEGLAELLSTLSTADGAITLGTPPATRVPALSFGATLSAERILSAYDLSGWSAPTQARFYAHAWALTHYLYLGRARSGTARHAELVAYVSLVDRGVDPESACREAFGLSVAELGRALAEYLGRRALPVARMPLSNLSLRPAAETMPPLRALAPAEHVAQLASLESLTLRNLCSPLRFQAASSVCCHRCSISPSRARRAFPRRVRSRSAGSSAAERAGRITCCIPRVRMSAMRAPSSVRW